MTRSSIIEIDGIGPITFEHSKRAKRLSISIRPFKGVRVAVPYSMPFSKAKEFVHARENWIRKHLPKMEQLEQKYKAAAGNSVEINPTAARRKLIGRLDELSSKYGFTYNRVFIRNQKTRWGSCSTKNNINLNMKLIRLPDELMDYVVLHELVHTRVKNHSKAFWAELDKLVKNAKKTDSRLEEYGLGLLC